MPRLFILCFFLAILAQPVLSEEILMSKITPLKSAPALKLMNINGKMENLADYKGDYVLVNFWAYWCGPCIKEFPALNKLYESLKSENLKIIAVHAGPLGAAGEQFLQSHPVSFQILVDDKTNLKLWRVPVLPVTYLVDPDGNLTYFAMGPRDWDVSQMKKLLLPDA